MFTSALMFVDFIHIIVESEVSPWEGAECTIVPPRIGQTRLKHDSTKKPMTQP